MSAAMLVRAELSEIIRFCSILVLSDVEFICHIISIAYHWVGDLPHPVSHEIPPMPHKNNIYSWTQGEYRCGPFPIRNIS